MSREELFEKIFRKAPPPRLREISVRLFLDELEIDQVKVIWDPVFTEYQFLSASLARYLDSTILPSARIEVNGRDGHFHSERLRQNQFGVELDEAEFVLNLSTPARLKALQKHSLSVKPSEMRMGAPLQPANFSAYLNSTWTQNWHYNERFFPNDSSRRQWERATGTPRPEREPLAGDLSGAIRTLGWVVQGTGRILEPTDGDWSKKFFTRNETRVVKDFPSMNSRLSLLDVSAVHSGASSSIPVVGGADLMLGDALVQGLRSEGSEVRFFLARPAEVTIHVNGNAIKSMSLGSGDHRIDGILGRAGHNDVEVRVFYADGDSEVIPHRFIQASSEVLPPGTRHGSVSGGFRKKAENSYGTTSKDFVGSATYTQGLSAFLNGSADIAGGEELQVGGASLFWLEDSVTSWTLGASISHSLDRFGQKWSLLYNQDIRPVSVTAHATYTQGPYHNGFFAPLQKKNDEYGLGLNLGSPIWRGAFNLNMGLQFKPDVDSSTPPINYAFGANYTLSGWKGLSLTALGNCVINSGEFTPSASLTMSYFFNTDRHSFYAMNQTFNQKRFLPPKLVRLPTNDSLRLRDGMVEPAADSVMFEPGTYTNEWKNLVNSGWSWSEGMGSVGGRALSVSGNYNPEQYGLRIGAQRTSNFAELSANYSMSDQNQIGLMSRSHFLSARASTSFLFADGLFAIGRPVQDGFVLVTGDHQMADTKFRINPSEQYNSEYSNGGPFLAASYGLLSGYRVENILVRPVNPPSGSLLEGDRFYAENTYKQGFVLKLGKPPRVLVRLRLIDESNQPMSYTTFHVMKSSDTTVRIHQSFSNKDGYVQIGDLEQGQTYVIRFGSDVFVKDLVITIPAGAPTILNLGDQKVQHETFSQLAKLSLSAPDPAKKTQAVASTPEPVQNIEKSAATDPVPASPTAEGPRPQGVN